MVKAYLRYEHAGAFGVISSNANVVYDASGKQVISGALESISFWNIRQGSQVSRQQQQQQQHMHEWPTVQASLAAENQFCHQIKQWSSMILCSLAE
jgi:hypothetical protein